MLLFLAADRFVPLFIPSEIGLSFSPLLFLLDFLLHKLYVSLAKKSTVAALSFPPATVNHNQARAARPKNKRREKYAVDQLLQDV